MILGKKQFCTQNFIPFTEGGVGDAELQGGGIPGAMHCKGDCEKRKMLGRLNKEAHSRPDRE